jgi:hypothetical protein
LGVSFRPINSSMVAISTPLPGSHAGRAGSGIVGVTSGALAEGAFLQGNLGSRYGRSGHGSTGCIGVRSDSGTV